jgi:ribosome assembly protein YihI (activator of Der GTPase)
METVRTTLTKDGRLSMLTKLKLLELRDSTSNSDSTSTDLSTSDQECQCKELPSATVPTMSGSRDGERTSEHNNGTSMKSQRPSRITTGSPIPLIFNQMVVQATSDAPIPTQDGGRCSDMKELLSETRKVRLSKLSETLMLKTETSESTMAITESINSGISFMLMNGRANQEKESLMRSLVFMSKETSTLFHNFQTTDTLT